MNLVIGLCIGIAAAFVLLVMWRMADRLRQELQSSEEQPCEEEAVRYDEHKVPQDRS